MASTVFEAETARSNNRREAKIVRDLVIRAKALKKSVKSPGGGTLDILRGVDLEVNAGEAVAILGASGSGKSTLLGLLAGLDRPSAGEVSLLGNALENLDEDQCAQLRLGKVGFVFQSFQLMPGMSALENVSLPLQLSGASDARDQATSLLGEVGLAERLHHLPQQLSGGEQQRVAIARAFAGPPRVLFADEPTGNLDSDTGTQIEQLLFDLRDRSGTALVLVTHEQGLADRCDRIVRMQGGALT